MPSGRHLWEAHQLDVYGLIVGLGMVSLMGNSVLNAEKWIYS